MWSGATVSIHHCDTSKYVRKRTLLSILLFQVNSDNHKHNIFRQSKVAEVKPYRDIVSINRVHVSN